MMGTPIEEVEFPDPQLQRCWERERGGTYAEDFPMLDCSGFGILSLEGIQVLEGLITLDMERNEQITGIELIAQLPRLENLYLSGCNITNEKLVIISAITSLVDLELVDNNLGDVSVLSNLTKIRRLLMSSSGVTSGVSALGVLTNAEVITLLGNPDSSCEEIEILRSALPEATIRPTMPEVNVDCR